MAEMAVLRGWHGVVSTSENSEGGWLINTATVRGAFWDASVLPESPRLAFLERTCDGEYVVAGIYDAGGFVHTCEPKVRVELP